MAFSPAFLLKFLLRVCCRVEVRGLEHLKEAGPKVLMVANHVSRLDAFLLSAFLPKRAVLYVLPAAITQSRFWRPIAPRSAVLAQENPLSAKMMIEALHAGRPCLFFPEGRPTATGTLMKIYEGPGLIADKAGAKILPISLDGPQYSLFSSMRPSQKRRFFPKITLTIGQAQSMALDPALKGHQRRQRAALKLCDIMETALVQSRTPPTTLIRAFMRLGARFGKGRPLVQDRTCPKASWRDLVGRIFTLAPRLARATPKGETTTALMLPNAVSTFVAFMALQVLGRQVAMLNFFAGPAQVARLCKIGAIKTVLTSRAFLEEEKLTATAAALTQAGVTVLMLEDLVPKRICYGRRCLAQLCPSLLLKKKHTEDGAVLLFTSGSEGAPKGVVLSHRAFLANSTQTGLHMGFGPWDKMFLCLPMFHSFGLTVGVLGPMFMGAQVFFYPSPLHFHAIPELIYSANATIMLGTDTVLNAYAGQADPYDFHAMRYVIAGAEKLKAETRRIWSDQLGVRILEGYGATETAPVITMNSPRQARTGTIGRVIAGIDIRLEPVEGLHEGRELWVRGPNLMSGYIKEDKPGILQPLEEGWYNTGDVVKIDEDGYVSILGRTKRFAKIGGEMVSLTAVEAVLSASFPGKRHAAVSVPHRRKGEMIVLLTESEDLMLADLAEPFRTFGLGELAVPREIVRVKSLPVLGSGKTDYVGARALVLEELGPTVG